MQLTLAMAHSGIPKAPSELYRESKENYGLVEWDMGLCNNRSEHIASSTSTEMLRKKLGWILDYNSDDGRVIGQGQSWRLQGFTGLGSCQRRPV